MGTPSTEGYAPEWLEYENVLGQRPLLGGSTQGMIEQFNGLVTALIAQGPPPDTSIQTRDEMADSVPVRIYIPPGAKEKKLPVGVFYHGGGYLLGNLDSEDGWCRAFVKHTPCILVSVDYRLSTTHKMPVMLEDSLVAYRWAWLNADKLGGDQSKYFTVGGSAGGGLALTVADQVIKAGERSHIQGVIAMVPITAHPTSIPAEFKARYTSYTENSTGVPLIGADSMRIFFEAAGADYHDERTFVTLSKNLAEFPRTYICTCGKDPLRDDGKVLEAMLKKAGVETKSDFYPGFPHNFWIFPGIKSSADFLENVVQGARWVLGK